MISKIQLDLFELSTGVIMTIISKIMREVRQVAVIILSFVGGYILLLDVAETTSCITGKEWVKFP